MKIACQPDGPPYPRCEGRDILRNGTILEVGYRQAGTRDQNQCSRLRGSRSRATFVTLILLRSAIASLERMKLSSAMASNKNSAKSTSWCVE